MAFLPRITVRPFRGLRLLRRLLRELRGIRLALERQADILERSAGMDGSGPGTFRSWTRHTGDADAVPGTVEDPEVSYMTDAQAAQLQAIEDDLVAVLGRPPTPDEVLRVWGEGRSA